ncbi:MAG: isocitrate lyase/PEP mutase family protein [Hyphomicrobiales bacterium]
MTVAGKARKNFREVLNGDVCIHPASVFDPVSARIAEDLEFEVGMFAGSIASLAVLGEPDAILLTLSEFVDQARRICRASRIPLMCDADHGYGNALNVMRTIEELENAGVAGLSIEDTLLPTTFDGAESPQLIPLEEGIGKINAALAAQQDRDLVIVGRTSAALFTDSQDAARRLKAYEKCGVDALFAVGVQSRSCLEVISEATTLPLIVGGIDRGMMDLDYLASRRVRLALQGHQPFAAAVRAIHDTLKALRDGAAGWELENVASPDLMKQVMRLEDFQNSTNDYLKSK